MHHGKRPELHIACFQRPGYGGGVGCKIASKGTTPLAEIAVLALRPSLVKMDLVGLRQVCATGIDHMPVAVIQSGSTENEKVAIGTINTIVEIIEEKKITSPALIVIGEVVSLHPQFQPIREFYGIISQE